MNDQEKRRQQRVSIPKLSLILMACIVVLSLLVFIFLLLGETDPSSWVTTYLNKDTNRFVFVVLMALLPVAGMPISIFLVLVAILFGLTWGILLTAGLVLLHLALTYYLTHTLFRPLVLRLLSRYRMGIFKMPQKGAKRLALVFMLFPGLPYAVKNYLLALSDLPFLQYLVIGWVAQFALSVPFILLGRAVIKMDPLILGIALFLILLGLIGQQYLRRRYKGPTGAP